MILKIRNFISNEIKKYDSKFEQHFLHSTNSMIGSTRFDRVFWIEFISCQTQYSSNTYLDRFDLFLEIGRKGGSNPIESHDKLWCDALKLRDRFLANYKNFFENFQLGQIDFVPIESQENWSKLRFSIFVEQTLMMRGVIE